jgi:hypothetical protein
MHPQRLELLRAILRAPEDRGASALDEELERLEASDKVDIWLFLHGRIPEAGSAHASRMQAMLERIEARFGHGMQAPELLAQLASELDGLRQQAGAIDRDLKARRRLLAALLGPDQRAQVGPFSIRTSAPSFAVKVLDEQAVPAAFLKSSPDRKTILKHFQDTGEIPPGTDVNPRATVVTVTRKG